MRKELGVALQALRWTRAAIDERVSDVLEALGLAGLAEANPFSLSGGQKRRLSVATVLVARPAVLVLDEPTFGQDRLTWLSLMRLLQLELERGATIVSVTHDPGVIEHLGDHRILLEPRSAAGRAA